MIFPALTGIKILTLVKKIPYQVWILIGLVIAFWAWGSYKEHKGAAEVQAKWDASVKKGRAVVKALQEGQGKVTVRVVTEYKDKVRTVYEQGKTVIQQVPVYIPQDIPDLPYGFRVLHDAAASGTIPGAAEGTDGASVPVREATTTIIGNYTACHATAARLTALQDWVSSQRKLYLEECKRQDGICN